MMKLIHNDILDEFSTNAKIAFEKITENTLHEIITLIISAKKIYVLGIGHSGMFVKILSMKLNHVGLKAYTVFDEINPPFEKDDLFIAISQSGETKTIVALAEKAKTLSGNVLGVTTNSESTLARLSKAVLKIDDVSDGIDFPGLSTLGDKTYQNLTGCLFGFNIYVLFYSLIIMIANERGESPGSIDSRHANLQ
ncbi:MAG: SIS domain-containing protein [Spirochaetota bacterium]|nr:MAG: SIS domain-containing protein [Spirochaetota bacterium]